MAVIAALLFVLVLGLTVALVLAGVYYVRVVRPQLVGRATPTPPGVTEPSDPIAAVVDELNALARLRDQGVLTSREFSSKKRELLERI
jgi:hypothetical protein